MTQHEQRLNKALRALGDEYTVLFMDLEHVVYRDFGDGFEVEISPDDGRRLTYSVFVWALEISKYRPLLATLHIPLKGLESSIESLHAQGIQEYRQIKESAQ